MTGYDPDELRLIPSLQDFFGISSEGFYLAFTVVFLFFLLLFGFILGKYRRCIHVYVQKIFFPSYSLLP